MKIKEKILHLTLKKQWFDMIKSGEKTEEYREFKPYWIKHLCYFDNEVESLDEMIGDLNRGLDRHKDVGEFISYFGIKFVDFTHIIFTNGYGKDKPSFKIDVKELTISNGYPLWGGSSTSLYLVFKLGNII